MLIEHLKRTLRKQVVLAKYIPLIIDEINTKKFRQFLHQTKSFPILDRILHHCIVINIKGENVAGIFFFLNTADCILTTPSWCILHKNAIFALNLHNLVFFKNIPQIIEIYSIKWYIYL